MSREELEALRARLKELEAGDEALVVAEEILALDPDDVAAPNWIGRSLEALGRIEEALEHWQLIVELQPDNVIAPSRLTTLKHTAAKHKAASKTPSQFVRRDPVEIVEPNLTGAGRGACLRLLAQSIRMTEKIDAARLAVTDRPSDGRFRVSGGKGSGITPWKGMLCVFVHAPAVDAEADAAIRALGGAVVFEAGGLKSLPESREYGVPFERVAEAAELLERPHREHLVRSIDAGPAPWARRHDEALREYILQEADAAVAAGVA